MERENLIKIVVGAVVLVVAVIPIVMTCFSGVMSDGSVTTYTNDDGKNRGIDMIEYAKEKKADGWHVRVGFGCTWYELFKNGNVIETWGEDAQDPYHQYNMTGYTDYNCIPFLYVYDGGYGSTSYFRNAAIYVWEDNAVIDNARCIDITVSGKDITMTPYTESYDPETDTVTWIPGTPVVKHDVERVYLAKTDGKYMLGEMSSLTYTDEDQILIVYSLGTMCITFIGDDYKIKSSNTITDVSIDYVTEDLEGGGTKITSATVYYTIDGVDQTRQINSFDSVMPYTVSYVDGYVTPTMSIVLSIIPILILVGIVFWVLARFKMGE